MIHPASTWRAPAIIAIAFTVVALVLFDPIPQPAQSILGLALTAILGAFAVQAWFANPDDVVKESRRVAWRWGAPIGFAAAILAVIVVRYAQPVSDALARLAGVNPNAPPSTVAFALGVVFTIVCAVIAHIAIFVGWWIRKR